MDARHTKDCSHEYLVEVVALQRDFLANMLNMILQHHPYMGPAATEIADHFNKAQDEIEARYPVSQLVVPSHLSVVKPPL